MIVISFNDNDLSEHLKGIADRINNNLSMWRTIGEDAHKFMAVDHFRKEENPDGSKWRRWALSSTFRNPSNKKSLIAFARTGRGDKLLEDTGMMKGEICFEPHQNDVKVISPKEYSKYHHFGTSKMPMRRFMYLNSSEIAQIVKTMIREIFRR